MKYWHMIQHGWKHYAMWNKSDWKGKLLHDSIYVCMDYSK